MRNVASLKRLKLSNFKLNTLLNISQAINDDLPTDAILKKFEDLLCKDLNIGKVLVFSLNKNWKCILASGIETETTASINFNPELLAFSEITSITSNTDISDELYHSFDVIIPVFHNEEIIAFVVIGDIDEERKGISPTIKHLNFIQTLTNLIIVAIENKRLHQENLKQEAIKKELEFASKIQSMLIPSPGTLPNNSNLHFAGYYLPHSEVGGDYYDVIKLSEDEYGFCIADVSGKGVSAALLMSNFQANLRAFFKSDISLEKLVVELNEIVTRIADGEKFVTIFLAKYNTITRELRYINAGHNAPVLYHKNNNTTEFLELGCIGVGMLDEIPFINKGSIYISPNDELVCYTDGIIETENHKQEEFGIDRISKCMEENDNPEQLITKLIEDLDTFRGDVNYIDDISIISCKFH